MFNPVKNIKTHIPLPILLAVIFHSPPCGQPKPLPRRQSHSSWRSTSSPPPIHLETISVILEVNLHPSTWRQSHSSWRSPSKPPPILAVKLVPLLMVFQGERGEEGWGVTGGGRRKTGDCRLETADRVHILRGPKPWCTQGSPQVFQGYPTLTHNYNLSRGERWGGVFSH